MMPAVARVTCEQICGQTGGEFGFVPVRCSQSVAVHRWYDSAGNEHRACSRHIRGLESRFPPSDAPEPDWLHLDPVYADDAPDPLTEAKGYVDWLESELREAHGGR